MSDIAGLVTSLRKSAAKAERYMVAIAGAPHLRIAPQITNEDDFVDTARHGLSPLTPRRRGSRSHQNL